MTSPWRLSALAFRVKQAGARLTRTRSTRRVLPPPTAVDDAIHEHALLLQVLELHPTHLALPELIRRMGADPSGAFELVDPWRRAVRELWRDELVRLDGPVVAPTKAALRLHELFEL